MLPERGPTGTVAIAHTRIDSSAELWERHAGAMVGALKVHDQLLRRALERLGGYEASSHPGSFKVVFTDVVSAVNWAFAVQRELLRAPWSTEVVEDELLAGDESAGPLFRGLRVAIAIEYGEPYRTLDKESGHRDYFGEEVDRARAVADVARGGQVVLCHGAWGVLQAGLGTVEPFASRDLGQYTVGRDSEPTRLWQLLPEELAERQFDPLALPTRQPRNYTVPQNAFVGREREIEELVGRLRAGDRVMTIHGGPGLGKTRLALHLSEAALAEELATEARLTDLNEASDLEGVCREVAEALELPLAPGPVENSVEQLGRALGARGALLLLLDTCENAADAVAKAVDAWRLAAPDARFLLTSRAPLPLGSDSVHHLDQLSFDAVDGDRSPAVALFLDRAARYQKQWGQPALETATAIVKQLDGIPLAIELAVTRLKAMSPEKLLARLTKKWDTPRTKDRDVPERQRTLRAAIEWSWQLLSPAEQSALSQCALFAGGFSLDTADAVLVVEGGPSPQELVASLRDHGLLRSYTSAASQEIRFAPYDSVREFALAEMPADARERCAVRHARHYASCGFLWTEQLRGPNAARARAHLDEELDNLLAALNRMAESTDGEAAGLALGAAIAVDGALEGGGSVETHRDALDRGIARGEQVGGVTLARAYRGRARLHQRAGNAEGARADFVTAVELAAGSPSVVAQLLIDRAILERECGAVEVAGELLNRSEKHLTEHDEWLRAYLLTNRAILAEDSGSPDFTLQDQAIAIFQRLGDAEFLGITAANLGVTFLERGDFPAAVDRFDAARSAFARAGTERWLTLLHCDYAEAHLGASEFTSSARHLDLGIEYARRLGFPARDTGALELSRGRALLRNGELEAAVEHLQAALNAAEGADQLFSGLARAHLGFARAVAGKSTPSDIFERAATEVAPFQNPATDALIAAFASAARAHLEDCPHRPPGNEIVALGQTSFYLHLALGLIEQYAN